MSETSEPLFSSGVEGPSELLARVRRRLASENTGIDVVSQDPVLDLAKPDGLTGGWYDAEIIAGQTMRWTQRRFDFEAVAAEATHVNIEACLFPESGFASLTARISAGEVPGVPFVIRPGWNSVLVPIPGGRRGHIAFSVDAGGSWCPAGRTGADDIRELSLLVRRIALVRFVELPRFEHPPLAPGAAERGPGPRPTGVSALPGRILRKLLRLANIDVRVASIDNRVVALERRLGEMTPRLDETMALLEKRLTLLAEVDAQIEIDIAGREEALRDDIGRKVKDLRRD